ncbi:MAG: M24 family metallopeptidase [Idiomarina sp.]
MPYLYPLLLIGGLLLASPAQALPEAVDKPLPLQQRGQVIDTLLQQRLETLAPQLMRKHNIDMWILVSREYNEDPVLRTMLPSSWISARRRTILVLSDRGIHDGIDRGVEALAVARYDVGDVFKKAWNPEQQPDQWARLAELVREHNPERIGVNQSADFAQADGLVATDKEELLAALDETYRSRIVSAEPLAVGWLETRIEAELPYYRHAVKIAHELIAEAFSNQVVEPGKTSTAEVEWWLREQAAALNLDVWFHPSVTVQRQGDLAGNPRAQVDAILPGDLLHVDFGITYLRLNTDTQQQAYVLRPNETDVPAYLSQALAAGNQVQNILTDQFKAGRTGNEILLSALAEAHEQGLQPSIYTHPIGYYGHGSGPTIGMWDKQAAIEGAGEYPLYDQTAYSIELNTTVAGTEWGQDLMIMLEEDAIFWNGEIDYLNGRQTELHVIRATAE